MDYEIRQIKNMKNNDFNHNNIFYAGQLSICRT